MDTAGTSAVLVSPIAATPAGKASTPLPILQYLKLKPRHNLREINTSLFKPF